MKIVFLDAKTIGDDIDLSGYDALGEVVKYGFSTPEEARERTKDADVIVLNKVVINEQSIGEAEHLKLVCVTATGTNNLDKEYLDQTVKLSLLDGNMKIIYRTKSSEGDAKILYL